MSIGATFENSATISTTETSLPNNSTTLTPRTEDGIYQAFIDLANLAAGDVFDLKIYEKVQSAGSQRLLFTTTFSGVQTGPFVTAALVLMHGWDMTLKKTAGTDRSIAWSIRQVA
jgi:hypothetical protein